MVGAGLVGLYMSLMLSGEGYDIDCYEKREKVFTSKGRRANLFLSYRAVNSLRGVGIEPKKYKEFVPYYGINFHRPD